MKGQKRQYKNRNTQHTPRLKKLRSLHPHDKQAWALGRDLKKSTKVF